MLTITSMTRKDATDYCRARLNEYGLNDWKIKLVQKDSGKSLFLGKCDYKEKTIYLNALHLDTHGELEVRDTINHEIAHALIPGDGHGILWRAKAIELGSSGNVCATYNLDARAIDAIRSGDILEVDYVEEKKIVQVPTEMVVNTPKYRITKYTDKCDVCKKIAIVQSEREFRSNGLLKKLITLECGHIRIEDHDSQSAFDLIVSNGWKESIANCKHDWNKTVCRNCGEFRLFPFQIEGARFIERQNGRAACFDEMGLGKTVQSLAYLKFHPEAFPVLFIVKSGIKFQWQKEIIRWLGEKYFPQVIDNSKQGVAKGLKCYITSYDLLRNFDKKKIDSLGIQTVVLDEVQAIKNPDATRTQEVRKLCKDIPHLIPLSGTPWKNRGSEFFVVLNMLSPTKFHSYQNFLDTWVDYYMHGNQPKQGGIRNIKKFKEYISDLAIRRERTEVMKELPTISRLKLHCQIEEHARKAYDEEVSDFVKWYNELVISGEEDSSSAQQNAIARLQRMRHILGLAKIPYTVDWAEEFLDETDRKLVIFVHHKDVGELLFNQLTKIARDYNVKVLKLHAGLSSEERFAVQEEFNKLPRSIMIASTLASGEGLNLQTCSDCVMHERQWNPMNEEQAEGRFIRIGQQANAVNATYIHVEDSTDTQLDAIVENKRRQFHAVMNEGVIPQWHEGSIIQELTQAIMGIK